MTPDPFDLAARFAPIRPPAAAGRGEEEGGDAPFVGEAAYVCDACGEEIVVPIDPAAGAEQEYVEDCPVCCRPNLLTVFVGPDGAARCSARPE
ncbi:CPXCG motif-containing cysteine-rich protein [Alienimonas sp. DA493]|uniref:CPXCG motif-containing cysteine-rich protein n=1 Tax=Alienimonas sp. DA493 TaxID=3373605 RepID=UPI00375471E7